mgnify:CR=1 FL=1
MTHQPLTGRMARTMQYVWLVETLLSASAAALMHRHGFAPSEIVAWLAGWFFGFRALIAADSFRNGERHKSPRKPEHQIGWLRALRLFVAEYWATLLTFGFHFPLERWRLPLAPVAAVAGRKTPIILIHGFICNRGYWKSFARALELANLGPVYAVSLEPLLGSVDEHARRLGEVIEQVCKSTGAPQVTLIGHSMGGLISRAYLHSGGTSRIVRIITLGSPHHGTYGAHPIRKLAVNAQQMCVKSEWLAALNAHESKNCPVPITSLLTPHDNIVYPQSSAVLNYPNARNVYFPGVGHVEMVLSPAVMQAVIAELQAV